MNPIPVSDAPAQSDNLLGQARQWLAQGHVTQMLSQVPATLKSAGTKTATRFNKLSTTQKVVGGTLLAVGAAYLARRNKTSKTNALADTL